MTLERPLRYRNESCFNLPTQLPRSAVDHHLAMSLITQLTAKLQRHPKRVVFPEGDDPRILQAARQFATKRLGVPILLGDRPRIKDVAARLDVRLDGIRLIDPSSSDDKEEFTKRLRGHQRFGSLRDAEIEEIVLDQNYYATLMLATGRADAVVSGATVSASSALRPLFQLIPKQEHVGSASSMQIVEVENEKIGLNGVLFLADCAVIPEPSQEQLSEIAVTTAAISHHLTNEMPRVALLSYTSKTKSSRNATVNKMKAATTLAYQKAKVKGVVMEVDGELQLDAALDPYIAEQKGITGSVSGKANVLIFPDLHCANIASKMVQVAANANVYGQIITGLTKPCAEISRGSSAHDIIGTAVVVACQAIDQRMLYGSD